jgi:hypothetical protein
MAKKTEKSTDTKKVAAKKPSASVKMKAAKPAKPATEKAVFKTPSPMKSVADKHKGKEALAKSLAEVVAREDEDTDQIADRLQKSSNQQLLRLQAVASKVKEKFGTRGKLIAAITEVEKKGKDKDYLAKLDSMSLPQLLDLATSAQRRARP